ncbi:MAG: hypothetical protein ACQGVK_25145 [Myxococcota bacterium]
MSQHPLIDLANDREVKQAKGFRKAASELTGAALAQHYKAELGAAPRRQDAGKRYLGNHPSKPPSERRNNRDEEHIAQAMTRFCREREVPLYLPREAGELRPIDWALPMMSASPDKAQGDADPNKGVGKIDLLAIGPEDVMTVVRMRYLAPDATRGGTGDTPLRQLLEGLAHTAFAEANRAAIQSEIDAQGGPTFSEDPPMLVLLASQRYWELCRRREAQKGAGWIRELERITREMSDESGVQIVFAGLKLPGDPEWSYDEQGPVMTSAPALEPGWERNAGKLKPRSPSRPKAKEAVEEIVEADPNKPVRSYSIRETYESGDRIQHPTLGEGVVQREAGPGKILVHFDEKQSLLIHGRA